MCLFQKMNHSTLRRALRHIQHIAQRSKTKKYSNTTNLKIIGGIVGFSGVTVATTAPISKTEEIIATFEGGMRFLR